MKLYLIRHAQSEANVRNILDTALPGPSLTDLGRQQAQTLAQTLAGEKARFPARDRRGRCSAAANVLSPSLMLGPAYNCEPSRAPASHYGNPLNPPRVWAASVIVGYDCRPGGDP